MNLQERIELRTKLYGSGWSSNVDAYCFIPPIDTHWKGTTTEDSRYHTIEYIADNILQNVSGVLVETGAFKGGMGVYMHKVFPNREIYLFDSFEGLEPVENRQFPHQLDEHQPGGLYATTEEECIRVLKMFDSYDERMHVIKGWFKDTTKDFPHDIALLRMDGDTYSATLEVLVNMYDKISPGGVIIIDDSSIFEVCEAVIKFLTDRGELDKTVFRSPYRTGNPVVFVPGQMTCGVWWQKI